MSHSPVLFESDDENEDAVNDVCTETTAVVQTPEPHPGHLKDEACVNNLRSILKGLPPPPNYTKLELNSAEILSKFYENGGIEGSKNEVTPMELSEESSLVQQQSTISTPMKPEDPVDMILEYKNNLKISAGALRFNNPQVENCKSQAWPEVNRVTYFDVFYNVGSFSEELTSLVEKYRERYISFETNSSFVTRSPTMTGSAKKRARRRAWGGYSPGRRLSHLAQRRRTFSSANLSMYSTNVNGRAILPGGSNNNKSAVSKKIIMVDMKSKNAQKAKSTSRIKEPISGTSKPNINQSKRALFQSPDQVQKNSGRKERTWKTTPNKSRTSKRVLWPSSEKKHRRSAKKSTPKKILTPKKTVIEDSDEEEDEIINANGKRLSSASDAGPAPKNCKKSLNFSSDHNSSIDEGMQSIRLSEPSSNPPQLRLEQLSQHHKQKMVWAVSSSLKQCGVNTSHELFRPAGAVLFKKCSQVWLHQSNNAKSSVKRSTSEQMFEIAIKYASETVTRLKSSKKSSKSRTALSSENFININNVPCEEKSKSGFSKVSDIFFNSVKNSQSSQEDPSSSDQVDNASNSVTNVAEITESNSNSQLSSKASVTGPRNEKCTEISNSECSNSTTNDSIEKNLRQIFDVCSHTSVKFGSESDSSIDLPKIFDEESQMSQFHLYSNNTPSSKLNLSIDKLSSDSAFNKPIIADETKNIDESLKKIVENLKTDVECLNENDSGFIDNECTSKSSKSLDVKPLKIDVQSPTSFTATVTKFGSSSVGKENEPLLSSENLTHPSRVENSNFSFKKFGTLAENVEPLAEKESNRSVSNAVISAQFDETAMSSCDISVSTTPHNGFGDGQMVDEG